MRWVFQFNTESDLKQERLASKMGDNLSKNGKHFLIKMTKSAENAESAEKWHACIYQVWCKSINNFCEKTWRHCQSGDPQIRRFADPQKSRF